MLSLSSIGLAGTQVCREGGGGRGRGKKIPLSLFHVSVAGLREGWVVKGVQIENFAKSFKGRPSR